MRPAATNAERRRNEHAAQQRRRQRLVDWLRAAPSGTLLESQVTASGLSRALDELLADGTAAIVEHPTVRERGRSTGITYPAAAVRLLEPR